MQVRSVTSIDVRACYEGSPTRSNGSTGTYSTRTVRMGIDYRAQSFCNQIRRYFKVLSYFRTYKLYGSTKVRK